MTLSLAAFSITSELPNLESGYLGQCPFMTLLDRLAMLSEVT
jgi:hypothetical protein